MPTLKMWNGTSWVPVGSSSDDAWTAWRSELPAKPRATVCLNNNGGAASTRTGTPTIDGYQTVAGDRILLIGEAPASSNGVWQIPTDGGNWTRPTEFATAAEIAGMYVTVAKGTTYGGRTYRTSFKATDTVGTTSMPWIEVAATTTPEAQLPNRLKANTGTSITDFNLAIDSGWYTASTTATNAPRTGESWFVEVVQFPNANNSMQRATILNGSESWQRAHENGVWGAWNSSGGLVGAIPLTVHTTTLNTGWTGQIQYQKFGSVVTVWVGLLKSSWAINDIPNVTGLPVGIRPVAGYEYVVGTGMNSNVDNSHRPFWIDNNGFIRMAMAGSASISGMVTYQVPSTERSTAMASGAESSAITVASGAGTLGSDTVAYVRGGQVFVNVNMTPTPGLAGPSTLFTLPVGYRPSTPWYDILAVVANTEEHLRIVIYPDGRVETRNAVPGGLPVIRGSLRFPAALSAAGLGTLLDTGWTNFTISTPNIPATINRAKYRRVGNNVQVRASLTLTSYMNGPALIDPPFPWASDTLVAEHNLLGTARIKRSGVAWYEGSISPIVYAGVNRFGIYQMEGGGSPWTQNVPTTMASGDTLAIDFEYEAAPL